MFILFGAVAKSVCPVNATFEILLGRLNHLPQQNLMRKPHSLNYFSLVSK